MDERNNIRATAVAAVGRGVDRSETSSELRALACFSPELGACCALVADFLGNNCNREQCVDLLLILVPALMILAPAVTGGLMVCALHRQLPSWTVSTFGPCVFTTLMMCGTVPVWGMQSIIVFLLAPLFLVCGALGGLMTRLVMGWTRAARSAG